MKILRSISKLAIGVSALVIPVLGVFISAAYTSSTEPIGFVIFSAILAITVGLAASLSWACVRYGGMSVKVAASLPAIPFAVLVALTLPALILGSFLPVLLWCIPLVLALVLGRRAAQFAQALSVTPDAEQD
jgi:hypothetical protein